MNFGNILGALGGGLSGMSPLGLLGGGGGPMGGLSPLGLGAGKFKNFLPTLGGGDDDELKKLLPFLLSGMGGGMFGGG